MTKEEIEKQRAAVEAMKGAKGNMEVVLQRVSTLEYALDNAKRDILTLRVLVGPEALTGTGNDQVKAPVFATNAIEKINRALGR